MTRKPTRPAKVAPKPEPPAADSDEARSRRRRRISVTAAALSGPLLILPLGMSYSPSSVIAAFLLSGALTATWALPPVLRRRVGTPTAFAVMVLAGAAFGLLMIAFGGWCFDGPSAECRLQAGAWIFNGVVLGVSGTLLRVLLPLPWRLVRAAWRTARTVTDRYGDLRRQVTPRGARTTRGHRAKRRTVQGTDASRTAPGNGATGRPGGRTGAKRRR